MKLFDTHAHLQFEKFDPDRDEVVKRNSSSLFGVVNPGASLETSEKGIILAQKVSNFYAAIGVHPHHVEQWDSKSLASLETMLESEKVVAVGEIGLDNYLYQGYPEPDIKQQKEILIPQIELAIKNKKPILFHCREAYDELYTTLKKFQPLKGLIHCFMGNKEIAKKFLDLGLFISFAGNLTYRSNDHMREAAGFIPSNKLLLETDSPYLSPDPLRGQRNEPINVSYVAQTLAEIKNIPLEAVGNFTTNNAKELFSL